MTVIRHPHNLSGSIAEACRLVQQAAQAFNTAMDQAPDYLTTIREYFRSCNQRHVGRGERIVTIDDAHQQVHYISAGYVRIFNINHRGEQYTHVIYGPGEMFPMTWLSRQPRTMANYEAMTDCVIYSQPVAKLNADLVNQPGLAFGMLQQAVEQYRVYSLRVTNLEYKYASERLVYRLVLLANRFGEQAGDITTIIPPLTHQLLANSLNLSRESVSREMEKLHRAGLVHVNEQRQIVITDIQRLADTARVPSHIGLT